jgi:hypothetical protein
LASLVLRTAVVLFGLCDEFVRYGADELEDVKVVLDGLESTCVSGSSEAGNRYLKILERE